MYKKIISLLIYFAYYLDTSHNYKKTKQFFYNILNNNRYRYKKYFDFFMIGLVLLSIWIIIYEVKEKLPPIWDDVETFMVMIFIIEYILRWWVYSDIRKIIIELKEEADFLNAKFNLYKAFKLIVTDKLSYVFSPLAIIDLLAILPNFRALRFLRIFLLFRLFKLLRYTVSINEFIKVAISKRFEFITVSILLVFITILFSTAIYFFEGGGQNNNIHDYFDAVYLSFVTMSTVGYGDISPSTMEGRIIAMFLMLTGIGVVSLIISIMVTAFNEKINELKENRIKAEVDVMNNYTIICGYSYIAKKIAQKLQNDNKKFIIVDKNPYKVEQAKKLNYLALEMDATKDDILMELGVSNGAKTIVALTKSDVTNIYITLSAKNLNENIQIISTANSKSALKKLYLAGASEVLYPFRSASVLAKEYIGQPVAFDALYGMVSGVKNVFIDDVPVLNKPFLVNKAIKDLKLKDFKIILFGIVRDEKSHNSYSVRDKEFIFNPSEDEILKRNDILIVLAHKVNLEHFKQEIEKRLLNVL